MEITQLIFDPETQAFRHYRVLGKVSVTPCVPDDVLDAEDRDVEPEHEFEVDVLLAAPGLVTEALLDTLGESVPINCLDSFDIEVPDVPARETLLLAQALRLWEKHLGVEPNPTLACEAPRYLNDADIARRQVLLALHERGLLTAETYTAVADGVLNDSYWAGWMLLQKGQRTRPQTFSATRIP